MVTSASHPYCIATVVTQKAVEALLEANADAIAASQQGSRPERETHEGGTYKDTHPWLVARDMFEAAKVKDELMPILFASVNADNGQVSFSHWSTINDIEVVELHRATWDTRCRFAALRPMNPIFEPIDSVFLKASDEQMAREQLEGIGVSRLSLDEHHIHPYAICETPMFILQELKKS